MSGPRDRPATSRAGSARRPKVRPVPAAQLGCEQPDRSRGRDPELPPQALDEPFVQRQRACAVAGVGQQAHQVAVSMLVERIARGPASAETDRALHLASSRRVGRQAPEHGADVVAVRVARAQRPLFVKPGQQLTAGQVQGIQRPSLRREPLELPPVHRHRLDQPDALAGGSHGRGADRRAQRRQGRPQARPGALVEHVWP